ncbi:MAG: DNA repair protein RecN [Aeromonadaceae bacterium]|nr:DNA repair protein RecN [Aeromonadaceae bacterium]
MLTQLAIQNFAIVRFLELELHAGMTCITGETGAGKSIAIDALGLCLGERAEASMVRPGADKAELSARFCVRNNAPARQWLEQNELADEEECLLRRVITDEGRSRAYINGTPVPVGQLKALGQLLLNIHGQHAHQLLLKPEHQLTILDAYAGHHHLLTETRDAYSQWRQQHHELQALRAEQEQRQARRQLLEYQVEELDEFALGEQEFADIEQEHSRLANSTEIVADCQSCLDLLYDNDEVTIAGLLNSVSDRLERLTSMDGSLQPVALMLQEALIQVQESHHELRNYLERLEVDPERFSQLEQRLSRAMELARKHHVRPVELYTEHQTLRSELANINGDEARLDELALGVATSKEAYLQAAERLSASRTRHAAELCELISAKIHALSMADGRLEIRIHRQAESTPSALGQDQIEFLVTTNPGQPLQPLAKVASGGELSRISLAIQVITAQRVATPTLIFDEVDVGISGPTAAVVGELLRELGKSTQVLVVTHLPQVAGQGHQHLFVSKLSDGKSTETSMQPLDRDGRLDELARLLGGNQITANTLANARELLIE